MDRTNTNFTTDVSKRVDEYLEETPEGIKNFLKEYQTIPFNYIMEKETRGIICFHATGTGKTLTAVAIAEKFRSYKRDILVISPKSLQSNFRKTIKMYNRRFNKKITDEELENIYDQYKFVTSNASNMVDQLKDKSALDSILGKVNKISLDNKIIIVDEAHNLFNGIVNGSRNANAFYELVMDAKNIKLILLTATPIVNNVFEIVPALNMCVGRIYTDRKHKISHTILPESYEDFVKYFIDEFRHSIKNVNKLKNRTMGLVSYTGDLFNQKQFQLHEDILQPKERENFPTQLPLLIEKIKMSKLQMREYDKAREKERQENVRGGDSESNIEDTGIVALIEKQTTNLGHESTDLLEMDIPEDYIASGGAIQKMTTGSVSSSYRIKSRQLSNILITKELEDIDWPNIEKYSPKIKRVYKNVNKHKGQIGIIYSGFLKYGLLAVAKYLEYKGYQEFNPNNPYVDKKTFAIYSGDVDAEVRASIISTFNRNENIDGKYINLILLSSSGAEGVSTRHCRHVHILEPYWNYERINQISARAIRYNSHSDLPTEDQNVQVYLYLSIFTMEYLNVQKGKLQEFIKYSRNIGTKLTKEQMEMDPPTDITLFKNSIMKKEINDQMLQILASVSIECNRMNERINFDCYSCVSNDRKLYTPDLDLDMLMPSACSEVKKIVANEVIIDGVEYYYTADKGELQVFKESPVDNNYYQVQNQRIIKAIKKELKL